VGELTAAEPVVSEYPIPSSIKEIDNDTFMYASEESDGIITVLKQENNFETTTVSISNDIKIRTNVIVAPEQCEFEVRRVTATMQGGSQVENNAVINIYDNYLGLVNNPNLVLNTVAYTATVPIVGADDSDNPRTQIDLPMRIGKNVRAFQVELIIPDSGYVIEALQIEYILRKRPISRGINPNT
jgi:hypothetical protein